mmetsp:Transcript_98796/g.282462  ORF Transcript_98796/g.282462 Transcript_98796/m.282462 type:complete len:412 (-) Transcript_98796:317-1552(-)
MMATNMSPTTAEAEAATGRYADNVAKSPDTAARALAQLRADLVPQYEDLVHTIVSSRDIDGGMKFVLDLRADLLRLFDRGGEGVTAHENASLRAMDGHLRSMLGSWFSAGFLELRRITFEESSGLLLEKIAKYEAVHRVQDMADLKARLGAGRRCFGFFHPCVPEEPLVFIHCALVPNLADTMAYIADNTGADADEEGAGAAIFYSITSTQPGLRGVDMGNFLIKAVVQKVRSEFPDLHTFSTLSPIPGFRKWLSTRVQLIQDGCKDDSEFATPLLHDDEATVLLGLSGVAEAEPHSALLEILESDWTADSTTAAALEPIVLRLAAHYLYCEKRRSKALDSVTNFHIRNGAKLERVNWLADLTKNGMKNSAGVMVNYKYELEHIVRNHEMYVDENVIDVSDGVLDMLKLEN